MAISDLDAENDSGSRCSGPFPNELEAEGHSISAAVTPVERYSSVPIVNQVSKYIALSNQTENISIRSFRLSSHAVKYNIPIFVESIDLSSERGLLVGHLRVKNLALEKVVIVKFSFDDWKTSHELHALYKESQGGSRDTWDRFEFIIALSEFVNIGNLENMLFCVNYKVGNRQFWDNTPGASHSIEFQRRHAGSTFSVISSTFEDEDYDILNKENLDDE